MCALGRDSAGGRGERVGKPERTEVQTGVFCVNPNTEPGPEVACQADPKTEPESELRRPGGNRDFLDGLLDF